VILLYVTGVYHVLHIHVMYCIIQIIVHVIYYIRHATYRMLYIIHPSIYIRLAMEKTLWKIWRTDCFRDKRGAMPFNLFERYGYLISWHTHLRNTCIHVLLGFCCMSGGDPLTPGGSLRRWRPLCFSY